MALFSTFRACSLIGGYSFPRDCDFLPRRGSMYPTEGLLEPLFTEVRGRGILRTSPFGGSRKFASGDSYMAYEYRPFGGCHCYRTIETLVALYSARLVDPSL